MGKAWQMVSFGVPFDTGFIPKFSRYFPSHSVIVRGVVGGNELKLIEDVVFHENVVYNDCHVESGMAFIERRK